MQQAMPPAAAGLVNDTEKFETAPHDGEVYEGNGFTLLFLLPSSSADVAARDAATVLVPTELLQITEEDGGADHATPVSP